jgi:hypothetical protein
MPHGPSSHAVLGLPSVPTPTALFPQAPPDVPAADENASAELRYARAARGAAAKLERLRPLPGAERACGLLRVVLDIAAQFAGLGQYAEALETLGKHVDPRVREGEGVARQLLADAKRDPWVSRLLTEKEGLTDRLESAAALLPAREARVFAERLEAAVRALYEQTSLAPPERRRACRGARQALAVVRGDLERTLARRGEARARAAAYLERAAAGLERLRRRRAAEFADLKREWTLARTQFEGKAFVLALRRARQVCLGLKRLGLSTERARRPKLAAALMGRGHHFPDGVLPAEATRELDACAADLLDDDLICWMPETRDSLQADLDRIGSEPLQGATEVRARLCAWRARLDEALQTARGLTSRYVAAAVRVAELRGRLRRRARASPEGMASCREFLQRLRDLLKSAQAASALAAAEDELDRLSAVIEAALRDAG